MHKLFLFTKEKNLVPVQTTVARSGYIHNQCVENLRESEQTAN